jgi:hypothetical protein
MLYPEFGYYNVFAAEVAAEQTPLPLLKRGELEQGIRKRLVNSQ